MEEGILTGLFLCSKENNEILAALKPEWSNSFTKSTEEKLKDVCINIADVFPWMEELSREIDYTAFSLSFFVQPDLFLRLRPGKEDIVKKKLSNEGIPFLVLSDNCLALPNTAKVDELLELDRDAVVQDFSSQQTGLFLQSNIQPQKSKISVWDCCAASGGKSIMVKDMLGDIELTVSDVRDSILANLKKRFASAGIKNYKSFVADLTTSSSDLSPFNLIICDAPCSGSGTWGRTPEQLYYFDIEEVNKYAALQKKIAGNALKNLKKGGYFLYITCSVFRKENEEVVDYLLQNFSLNLISMRTIAGYADKADTMFVALMQYN